jgi:hypothetical protein
MDIKREENQYMTKEEELRFGEIFRKVMVSEYPNPDRVGCPDTRIIRDLAFHRKVVDPPTFRQITTHMSECSECTRDALRYVEEYKKAKKRSHFRIAMAAAAAVMLTVALWAIWQIYPKQNIVAEIPAAPVQFSPNPIAVDAGNHQEEPLKIAKFEPFTIELPTIWRGPGNAEKPIILPRKKMQLEIRLPIGSPDGNYKLRIVDRSGKVHKTTEGIARTLNGVTNILSHLDISSLSQGEYSLSILEPGLDEWADYRLEMR